jgi:hypothetical protein
VSYPIIHIPT